MNNKPETYRVESDSVYEYDREMNAYVFIGKLNGSKVLDFIAEYEQSYML